VAQDEASDSVQPIDGAAGQHAEGLSVSASRQLDELRLHVSLPSWRRPIWPPTPTAGHAARWFILRSRDRTLRVEVGQHRQHAPVVVLRIGQGELPEDVADVLLGGGRVVKEK